MFKNGRRCELTASFCLLSKYFSENHPTWRAHDRIWKLGKVWNQGRSKQRCAIRIFQPSKTGSFLAVKGCPKNMGWPIICLLKF